jgi:hypothetical protein
VEFRLTKPSSHQAATRVLFDLQFRLTRYISSDELFHQRLGRVIRE